jgi:hypothetical protein
MPTTYESVESKDKKAAAKRVDEAAEANEKRAKNERDEMDDTADDKVRAAKDARDAAAKPKAEEPKAVNVSADGGKPEAADHRHGDDANPHEGPSVSSRPGPHGENG